MATRSQIIDRQPASILQAGLVAQLGYDDSSFRNLYFQRNVAVAPALDGRFDERAREIYAGLDTRQVFLPVDQREYYADVPTKELDAVTGALQGYSARSLEMIRRSFSLSNIEWLGLANRAGLSLIQDGVVQGRAELRKEPDSSGYVRHIPETDAVVVGPKRPGDIPITLAMYVADCLAIPIVDKRTRAFAFVHAGRPCTGLRLAEKAVVALRDQFGSDPADLSAYLGEGVCQYCYCLDEETYRGFVDDFGGKAKLAKVLECYPGAIRRFKTDEERNIGIDLYALNAYLLAEQGMGEIAMAPNCTARLSPKCISLKGTVLAEKEQPFYSHSRTKNRLVGWSMADGQMLELNTHHLSTPRNWTSITRC